MRHWTKQMDKHFRRKLREILGEQKKVTKGKYRKKEELVGTMKGRKWRIREGCLENEDIKKDGHKISGNKCDQTLKAIV